MHDYSRKKTRRNYSSNITINLLCENYQRILQKDEEWTTAKRALKGLKRGSAGLGLGLAGLA